jgi:hypothetical protein
MRMISNLLKNGKWFALGAALLVVAAALLNQTEEFYLAMIWYDFWQVMIHCWFVYGACALLGALFGAMIAWVTGGDQRKGFTVGGWSFAAALLACHIGFVVYAVLNYRFG